VLGGVSPTANNKKRTVGKSQRSGVSFGRDLEGGTLASCESINMKLAVAVILILGQAAKTGGEKRKRRLMHFTKGVEAVVKSTHVCQT